MIPSFSYYSLVRLLWVGLARLVQSELAGLKWTKLKSFSFPLDDVGPALEAAGSDAARLPEHAALGCQDSVLGERRMDRVERFFSSPTLSGVA